MKMLILFLTTAFAIQANAATSYYSCTVKEPGAKKGSSISVTVKFAVKGLDIWAKTGELVQYPGSDEEAGLISVSPMQSGKHSTMMSNLNGQGGDLRIEGGNLRLWGDGAGYQFTELVIWDADEEGPTYDGYVRDYGPTYGDTETFKQFIKCRVSTKP